MTPDLHFAGYSSHEAPPNDPLRTKWNAVRPSLYSAPMPSMPFDIAIENQRINSDIKYTPELQGDDEWQTPAQTWESRKGDCEDYAIVKYAALLKSGMPEDHLRLVVGEIKSAMRNNPAHAWCAAYLNGNWCALDNKFVKIIRVKDYINWIPVAAMHGSSVVRYGSEFTMAEMMRVK